MALNTVSINDRLGDGGLENVAVITTAPSGGVAILLPDGTTKTFPPTVTTLVCTAQSNIAAATVTPVVFNVAQLDENAAADLVNSVILIPPNATHVSLTAALKWNNLAATTGFDRQMYVQVDSGANDWIIVPGSLSDITHYSNSGTGVKTANFMALEKLPISILTADLGATAARLRLVCKHDAGAALSLSSMGTATYPVVAQLSASFFQ